MCVHKRVSVSVYVHAYLLINYYNSLSAWIVMGTVVAVIVIMAGIVITILLVIIYMLWKRYTYHFNSFGHVIIVIIDIIIQAWLQQSRKRAVLTT